MWVKKQQLESDMEQLTASKLREEYDKAVYCHPAYLSSMLSCCSVAQLCLTLGPHELQHTRIPCPSPSPRVCSNLSPLSQWCHPTISSPVIPLSSCLQSFPASGSFPVGQLFASSGQIIGLSASASILQMNIQGWFPLGLTGTMQSTSCEMPGWMNPKL